MIKTIDAWLIDHIETLVVWLQDVGIKQRWLEYASLTFYLLSIAYVECINKDLWQLFFTGIVSFFLISFMNKTDAEREKARHNDVDIFFRVFGVALIFVFVILGFIVYEDTLHYFMAAALLSYVLFVYLLTIGRKSDGHKEAVKLSWAKIKAMFGTEWAT